MSVLLPPIHLSNVNCGPAQVAPADFLRVVGVEVPEPFDVVEVVEVAEVLEVSEVSVDAAGWSFFGEVPAGTAALALPQRSTTKAGPKIQ